MQPIVKKIPVVVSDSDSDDELAPDKSHGAFCSSQQFSKADMQEKRNDTDELATRGSEYSDIIGVLMLLHKELFLN